MLSIKIIALILPLAAIQAFGQGQISGIDRKNLNLSIKPGNDFYEYSVGGWTKAHPLTPEYSSYGVTEELAERNRQQIRELIEGFAAHSQKKGTLEQKIGSLYNLAMDSTRRNKEGWLPLKPYLEQIYAIKNKKEFQVVSAQMERKGIGCCMFNFGAEADIHNATMNIVSIYQGGISMGERDYYLKEDTATVKIRNAYKKYVQSLFELVGNEEATANKKMQAVLAIETRIARASYGAVKLRDVEGNYHKKTYSQLINDFPGIDWGSIFLCAGYPAFKDVNVSQPEPIHEVEKILSETSLDDLKAYAEFKTIADGANSLDDKFRAVSFEFSKAMTGISQDRPRWKRAVGVVNNVMGMAVGKMFVEKYFPESSKKRMLELVNNLQTALKERIQAATWMSDATKRQAIDKLNGFYVKIGYPDKWKDYSKLQINDSLSYYENLVNASEFAIDDYIQRHVNKPVDKEEWLMTPQTINAYYNPTTNEICFPAGILQPPFFIPEADDAYNYGACGSTIGHEMTHGFDDQGSQFDKYGNVNNWWTEEDKKNFEKRSKVMADYFSNIKALPDMKLNGELTLGENIADNGGLNVAFQAFKNATKDRPLENKDGFTPDQRFFLAYGITWAENIRPELLRMYNTMDPHAPARWRVNGALPHIDAWYKAFNVKKGNKLYLPKAKRVDIW